MRRPNLLLNLTLSLLFSALGVHAAAPDPTEDPQDTQLKRPLIDRMHSGLEHRLDRYAIYFDGFFADERADEESAETQLRLISSAYYRESDDFSFKQRIKARVNLPRLKQRVNLLIDTESDDTSTLADQIPGAQANELHKEETSVALQLVQESKTDLGISHRVGLSLNDGKPNPKVRSQVRFNLQLSPRDLLRFTQAGFWEEVEGWGQESRIDYERLLHRETPDRSSLLRLSLRGLTSETSDGYEWSMPLEVLTALPGRRAYAVGASISGVTDTDTGITNTTFFLRYRQSLWRKWFFLDLTPQLEWPKEDGRETRISTRLSLEILF